MPNKDTIERLAYVIWQVKGRQEMPSTPEENWKEAERKLANQDAHH